MTRSYPSGLLCDPHAGRCVGAVRPRQPSFKKPAILTKSHSFSGAEELALKRSFSLPPLIPLQTRRLDLSD